MLAERLRFDARIAARSLLRQPAVTAAAVLTIALGLGASTAMFAVLSAAVAKPLPIPDGDGLFWLEESFGFEERESQPVVSSETFEILEVKAKSFALLTAYSIGSATLTQLGEARRLRTVEASSNFFRLLGVPPALGRVFGKGEDAAGGWRVAVLSHECWMRLFGGNLNALGRHLLLDDVAYEVVGVMPAGFYFPDREVELWLPMNTMPRTAGPTGVGFWSVLARLRADATPEQARAEGTVIVSRLTELLRRVSPAPFVRPPRLELRSLREEATKELRAVLWLSTAVVVAVMITAMVNLALLLLARNVGRQRELVLRTALGARPAEAAAGALVESALICAAGGAVGLMLAAWGVRLASSSSKWQSSGLSDVSIDWTVLVFLALCAMLVAGLAATPAVLQGIRRDVARTAAESDGGWATRSGSISGRRVRLLLATSELAISVMLVSCTAVLIGAVLRTIWADQGYQPTDVMSGHVALAASRYGDRNRVERVSIEILGRLQAIPTIHSVGLVSTLPHMVEPKTVALRHGDAASPMIMAGLRLASEDYAKVMRVRLRKGRWFTTDDRRLGKPVVVVNEAFARVYNDPNIVGQELPFGRRKPQVVGIVADMRLGGLQNRSLPEVYIPYWQHDGVVMDSFFLVARSRLNGSAVAREMRAAIQGIDAGVPLDDVWSMDDRLSSSLSDPRLYSWIVGLFALLAGLLSVVGVYGLFANTVLQRRRELAVRMAVGATPERIVRAVLADGVASVGLAVLIGGVMAWGGQKLIGRLVVGVESSLIWPAAGALLLVSVALAACYLPARLAASISPIAALRQE